MGNRIRAFKQRLLYNIKRPEMRILPGQLAFFFILTIIPLAALVGLTAGRLQISNNFLMENIPDITKTLVDNIAVSNKVGIEAVIFFVSALLLASKGTRSIILASNEIYKIKNSHSIRQTIKSVFMLFVLMFLLVFVLLVPVFGNVLVDFLIGIGIDAKHVFIRVYEIIKLPLSFVIIFMTVKLLYTMAPDKNLPSKEVNYGALFTTATWLLFTQLYALYIEFFPRITSIYGGISGLILLMWWIYFLAYFFVLGMALNVSKYGKREIEK